MSDPDSKKETSVDEILSSIRNVITSDSVEEESDNAGAEEVVPERDGKKEASVDEILSSIRTIISSDPDEADLTGHGTQEKTAIRSLGPEGDEEDALAGVQKAPNTESSPEGGALESPEIGLEQMNYDVSSENVSGQLADNVSQVTLGTLVEQTMHPVLLEWLNKNVPAIVEEIVKAEIKRQK